MIKSIVWSSMIDYPNQVSSVLFIGACNWRCEFCHNLSILDNKSIDFDKEILPKLIHRKNFINHVVISGGECTCYTNLKNIILKLNNNGFTVGIHTNGSNPDILKEILPHVEFIGMDIKTSLNQNYNEITKSQVDISKIKQSIQMIFDSGIEYDFRTTVYPKYVDLNDCVNIADLLKAHNVKQYALQQFDDRFIETDIKPYKKEYLEEIKNECNKYIPTILRGF